MATIIDSLIVELGLDPKNFEAGQKKAAAAFVQTRKSAQDEGKKVEDVAGKMADGFASVTRKVLELYAVFLGGKGLVQFTQGLVAGNAALGRFARNIGTSPQLMYAWGMAVERVGGNAKDAASTLDHLGKALYDLRFNGKPLPVEFFRLEALTHQNIPTNQGITAYLNGLSGALKTLQQTDPQQAYRIAQALGIDPGTYNVMIERGNGLQQYLKQLQDMAPTNAAIKAAQKLQDAWNALQQQAVSLANKILEVLGPVISDLLKKLQAWIDKNQEWIKTGIVNAVQQFADTLKNIDWKAVGAGIAAFASGAKDLVDALGGAVRASEILFGLWAGSKILGGLRGIAGGAAAAGGAVGGGMTAGLAALFGFWPTKMGDGTIKGPNRGGALPNTGGLGWNGAANVTSNDQGTAKAFAQESYNFWRSKGLSKAAAIAMVGNEQGESGMNPNARGDKVNGAYTAGGSFQWHKDRRDKILAATGIDVWSPKTTHRQMLQAAYLEMSMGLDKGAGVAWDKLQNATTVQQGIVAAVKHFERPLNPGADAQKRLAYARSWAGQLNMNARTAPLLHPGQHIDSSSSVHVGEVHVHTQPGADGEQIAADTMAALKKHGRTAATANTGLY